jgi:hypothetical protein
MQKASKSHARTEAKDERRLHRLHLGMSEHVPALGSGHGASNSVGRGRRQVSMTTLLVYELVDGQPEMLTRNEERHADCNMFLLAVPVVHSDPSQEAATSLEKVLSKYSDALGRALAWKPVPAKVVPDAHGKDRRLSMMMAPWQGRAKTCVACVCLCQPTDMIGIPI